MIAFPQPVSRANEQSVENFFEYVFENHFKPDFIDNAVHYNGQEIEILRTPLRQGCYNPCFWHMATRALNEGAHDEERVIDEGRCSRIVWAKPTICATKKCLVWEKEKKGRARIYLWANHSEEDNYLVALERRELASGRREIVLWTGFPVEYKSYRKKLLKEYNQYLSEQKPTPSEMV